MLSLKSGGCFNEPGFKPSRHEEKWKKKKDIKQNERNVTKKRDDSLLQITQEKPYILLFVHGSEFSARILYF